MHTEQYHGFTIVAQAADDGTRLSITNPRGGSDTVVVAAPLDAAVRRARTTIDTVTDYYSGRCRCGAQAEAVDGDGRRCCPSCVTRHSAGV